MPNIIAIDGPSGSGKGTISKLLAERLKYSCMDTGAMYRCCALYFMNNDVNQEDISQVEKALSNIEIDMKTIDDVLHVYLNGEDVSKEIRSAEVTANVSAVSAIPEVRRAMVEQQRKLAQNDNYILEGRDIGTKVFPDAFVKIYLDATPEERAKRRLKQNQEKGLSDQSYEEVLQAIKDRDYYDSHRETDPLRKADDAILVDSTNLTIDEVVDTIYKIVVNK
ncbi:MAG: (d)CMP kinase [Clostridia bacterium]|nr:(d)CMP kinase [Clostridia bacterium]